ncbi:hypothetical protein D3C85_1263800 [compost metagenome]
MCRPTSPTFCALHDSGITAPLFGSALPGVYTKASTAWKSCGLSLPPSTFQADLTMIAPTCWAFCEPQEKAMRLSALLKNACWPSLL